jgi:hypothetical protein
VTAVTGAVRFVTANLDWATGEKKDTDNLQHLVKRLYTNRPGHVEGVVLGAQEARNLRIAGLLTVVAKLLQLVKIPVPKVVQGIGAARAGTAIAAFGVKLHYARLILSAATSKVTLARWVTRAGVDVAGGRVETFVLHVKPPRAGRPSQVKQLRVVEKLCRRAEKRGHGWVVLADYNLPKTVIVSVLRGVYYGTPHGIGICVSKNLLVTGQGRDSYGVQHKDTDHPAWFVDVSGLKA